MKIRLKESQYNLLKELRGAEKTYIVNLEIPISSNNPEEAVRQMEMIKQQVIQAIKNAEVGASLYEKARFGSEPKRIK